MVSPWSKVCKVLFWCATSLILLISQTPSPYLPSLIFSWWDKAQHTLAFMLLAILGLISYPYCIKRLYFGLVLLGGLIEAGQWLTGWRHAELYDWLSDLIGLGLGYFAFNCLAISFGPSKINVNDSHY